MIDPDQRLIGTIDDVVYDEVGEPIWAVVELGLMRSAHYLPVAAGYLSDNGKFVEREDAEERLLARATAAEGHNSDLAKQSQSPATGRRLEARNPKHDMSGVEGPETSGACAGTFVKRSQCEPGVMGATPFMDRPYDDTPPAAAQESEANQSQFHKPISARAVEEAT